MPKFKPGNIVARVALGESWRKLINTDYLHAEFESSNDDDDADGSSIISISTSSTATFDELPGTGKTIDTYIYQPMGRWIERLAMRFTIASLHPACIAQYLGSEVSVFYVYGVPLHVAIEGVCSDLLNGSTMAAGLKGLVKQTQSNSIDRSAAALAALIRVSLVEYNTEVYANISCIEPIFHLESLVCSHPDKKWFLFLVKLGRETNIAIRRSAKPFSSFKFLGKDLSHLWPSQETAQNLRQRLIRVLKVYRLSGLVSLEDTIGEACAICAEVVSTCLNRFARGGAYMHILDTVYFTIIFILRSIYELADLAKITNSKLIYMVLRTLACWVDSIVYQCLDCTYTKLIYDLDLLKVTIAVRSLVLVDVENGYMLLPESSKNIELELLPNDVFPRRDREANKYLHHIESLIETAKQRTRRLYRSFDELEIEVRGCTSQSNYCTQFKIIADLHWRSPLDFGDEWQKRWKITLERALRVRVQENSLTKEFRFAQWFPGDRLSPWTSYQVSRMSRHKWGQYLRSIMDWDWDLGTCMRHLFKAEPAREGQPPATQRSPATYYEIDADEGQGETWRLEAQKRLPKQVQIAYKMENGETQYMSFVPASPGPKRGPVSETGDSGAIVEESVDPKSSPMLVQDDSESRNEETEDGISSSSDENEQFFDCESISFGDREDKLEVQQALYDVGIEGAREGEDDLISICSLD